MTIIAIKLFIPLLSLSLSKFKLNDRFKVARQNDMDIVPSYSLHYIFIIYNL